MNINFKDVVYFVEKLEEYDDKQRKKILNMILLYFEIGQLPDYKITRWPFYADDVDFYKVVTGTTIGTNWDNDKKED